MPHGCGGSGSCLVVTGVGVAGSAYPRASAVGVVKKLVGVLVEVKGSG